MSSSAAPSKVDHDVAGRIKQALARPLAALNKLSTRDRLLLGGATLALVVGAELLLIAPQRDKRLAIEAAAMLSQADQAQAQAEREQQAMQSRIELEQRAARAGAVLDAAGASAAPRESLRFLLSRTLTALPVQVLSLRALGVEEIVAEAPPADEAMPITDAAGAAPAAVPLYRHRYELTVSGAFDALLQVVDALEHQARPLRLERVQLRTGADGTLHAGIRLVTLGTQRTWLSL